MITLASLAPALRRPARPWSRILYHAPRTYSTPSSSSGNVQAPQVESQEPKISSSTTSPPPTTAHPTPLRTHLADVPQDGFLPDLMQYDKLLDQHSVADFPPTQRAPFANRVIVRNDPSMIIGNFYDTPAQTAPLESLEPDEEADSFEALEEEDVDDEPTSNSVGDTANECPLTPSQIAQLHVYPLLMRRVTQQTGKGKIHSMYSLVVVGDGNGLVGYGEGKDDEAAVARDKALAKALRSMDYVERFEKRTFWTEMENKFGSTKIILRPRPVGFGLRCNPNVHQVLKAAGIKDASAKVWGSRNPLMVIKGLFRMLQAGHAPLGMGNGVGGGMRRLDKGSGLRNKSAIERDRGRKMVNLRTL